MNMLLRLKKKIFILVFGIHISIYLVNSTTVLRPRGVSLQNKIFYNYGKKFHCLDGTGVFPFNYINDDYCDCQDGSDEPGTSACPNGKFHCLNSGHIPHELPASRVNDGICDCCDGSDEYNTSASCINSCRELGIETRVQQAALHSLHTRGQQDKESYAKKGKELKLAIKKDLLDLQQTYNELKSQLEHIKATSQSKLSVSDREAGEHFFRELDKNGDNVLTFREIQKIPLFDYDQDGTVTEDEAKFYLRLQDSITMEEFISLAWRLMKPLYKKYFAMDLADIDPKVLQREQHQIGLLERSLGDMEAKLKEKRATLEMDYGLEEEFHLLKDQCFHLSSQEHSYSLCLFQKVTQRSSKTSSDILLGTWSSWAGLPGDRYKRMAYRGGQACGPHLRREALVTLKCGLTNELESVSEPSRCHYQLEFSTPAACGAPASLSDPFHSEL